MPYDIRKKEPFSVTIRKDAYQKLINDTLGDKQIAQDFVANIMTVVSNNPKLQDCDAGSIIAAGLMANSLKLPLSPTLGFAYVIPYGDKAQFQIGYKGFIQLALRTNEYEKIGVRVIHEGEYAGMDEFGEDQFKFDHKFDDNKVIGYFAYFKQLNGFKKTLFWTDEECAKHGHKYSKAYSKLWTSDFDSMSSKTVLKQLISKFGIMSTDIQKAIKYDQSVIDEKEVPHYVDNPNINENYEIAKDNNGTMLSKRQLPSDENGEVEELDQPTEKVALNEKEEPKLGDLLGDELK